MSSFICSPKHFNSIEFYLKQKQEGNDQLYCLRELAKTKNKWATGEEIKAFVDILRELNVLCCSLQYKHHFEGKLDQEIQEQRDTLLTNKKTVAHLTDIGAYKALQCLSYQIELKHLKDLRALTTQEELAMKLLEEATNEIASQIVRNLPGYDTANWGL
jgi:hypothetical protein